jgi:hypothetical protein
MLRSVRNIGFALALAASVPAGAAFAQVVVQSGGLLPSSSNGQGEPQPTNSLPQGFYAATPVGQHRQTPQDYWSGQNAIAGANIAPRG